jgi:hypothetical protein
VPQLIIGSDGMDTLIGGIKGDILGLAQKVFKP